LLDERTMSFLARLLLPARTCSAVTLPLSRRVTEAACPPPVRHRVVVALAVFLAGCTHADATRIGGPDSAPVFDVRCAYSMDHCYEKAAELCPDGYRASDSGGYLRAYSSRWGGGAEFHGYVTAECKAEPAKVE
jgi:hypothetical protein